MDQSRAGVPRRTLAAIGREAALPVLAAALTGIAILTAGAPAAGDAASGSAAFAKGDYVRAMADWTSAADRGDPDAAFGLGMLYERGDGQSKQSYKQADHWYRKAAEHDHIGAQYRLSLIWAAGADDLPADLVEAYKWILLASERGVATDVKAQFEEVIDRRQQAEGRNRAASWKAARAAKKAEAASAAASAPVAPGSSGGSTGSAAIPPPRTGPPSAAAASGGKSGGCPGWPFPTLPCTEQFPALPGAPAARAPAIPPPRAPGSH